MKNARPAIKIPYSTFERLLEFLAAAIFLSIGFWIWESYQDLPDTIPIHFNFAGQVDAMGPRSSLLKLYGIMALLYFIMSFVSRYPRYFNYPTAITAENAPTQYRLARRLVNTIKVESLGLLAFVVWASIAAAKGESFSYVLMPAVFIFIGLIFITIILYLIKLMKPPA